MSSLIASMLPAGLILPLLVFMAETCVLTLATLRTIFIARGKKLVAAGLGFFEVSIWLFAISQVMQNLTSASCSLAFAAGFALGNFLGVLIEQKLALGNLSIQLTTNKDPRALLEELRSAGYGVTQLSGHGTMGPVAVVFTVVPRKERSNIATIIRRFDSSAFYSVHDLQTASEGVFPKRAERRGVVPAPLLQMLKVIVPTGNRLPVDLPLSKVRAENLKQNAAEQATAASLP